MNSNSLDVFSDQAVSLVQDRDEGLFGIDLGRILNVVRRNLLWIVLIVGGCLAAGLVLTMLSVPYYRATSKILIELETDQIIEGTELTPSTNGWDIDRYLQTQVDIIESRSLAERVVTSEKLADNEGFFRAMGIALPDPADLEDEYAGPEGFKKLKEEIAADVVHGSLSASLPNNSRIISIDVFTADPAMSASLADAYAKNFIEANLNRKFDSSAYARQFLSDQLDEAKARLEKSERELNQYSRAAGLIRVASQGPNSHQETTLSVTNDTLIQVNESASQATAERAAAQDKWETIEKEPVLSVPEVLENPAVQDLMKQKTRVMADLAQEKARHLDGHPTVQALKAQVKELDDRIEIVGNSIKRSVYLEYRAAQEKEDSLTGKVAQLQSAALNEQDRGVEYNLLKRVAETNRSLYDTLLARYNQLSAIAGAASNNVTMVDRAEIPTRPSSPNLPLNMVLALMFGLLFSALFVFLRDYFDDTIRAPEDVEQKLGLSMLGLVPVSEEAELDLMDSKSSVSEGYHSLVTNLMYSTSTGLPKTLLVTSASEGEGKTTTAYAVALDLARLGRSVLLIDSDLRRPTLHRRVEGGSKYGLTDLLTGQAHFDEALIDSGEPNLTYITGLPIPPEPSILLGGGRLPRILEAAESRFDSVVIDSPPLLGLSDAATISTQADAVMMVVDASGFRRGAVKSAVRRLNLVNANVLGVVLTKFDPSSADGEYSYYGYNYYQYGDDRAFEA